MVSPAAPDIRGAQGEAWRELDIGACEPPAADGALIPASV